MTVNTAGEEVEKGQAADLFDYTSRLFQWRKTKDVIHSGKTLHFISRGNSYGYFRYNDTDAVFVFVNASCKAKYRLKKGPYVDGCMGHTQK